MKQLIRTIILKSIIWMMVITILFLSTPTPTVQFYFAPWIIELPCWLLMLLGLSGFYTCRLMVAIMSMHSSWLQRFVFYKSSLSQTDIAQRLHQVVCWIIEGEDAKALAELHKLERISPDCLLVVWFLSYLAYQHGEFMKSLHYLQRIGADHKSSTMATMLLQAKWQLEQQSWQESQTVLQQILRKHPKQLQAISLLQQVYYQSQQWLSLLECISQKGKHFEILLPLPQQKEFFTNLLRSRDIALHKKQLQQLWLQLPVAFKIEKSILYPYLQRISRLNDGLFAKQILADMVKYYPPQSIILAANGLVAYGQQNWNQAKTGFHQSLLIEADAEIDYLQAKLYEQQGVIDKACQHYKRGLMRALNMSTSDE